MSEPELHEIDLFNEVKDGAVYPANERWHSDLLEQYKLYVEMADRISQRRAAANTYFLSVNSAILAFVGYLTSRDSTDKLWMLAAAGVALCWLWKELIASYRNLNKAKFKIVHTIEKRLAICPYEHEWTLMGRGTNPKLYRPVSHVESGVPWVFIVLHLIVLYQTFPWLPFIAAFS